jgi:hypothetical protein
MFSLTSPARKRLIDYYIEAVDSTTTPPRANHSCRRRRCRPPPEPGLTIFVYQLAGPPSAKTPPLTPRRPLDRCPDRQRPADADFAFFCRRRRLDPDRHGPQRRQCLARQLGSFSRTNAWFYVTASDAETSVTNNNFGANYSICCVSSNTRSLSTAWPSSPPPAQAGESVEILTTRQPHLSGVGFRQCPPRLQRRHWTEAPGDAMSQPELLEFTFTIPPPPPTSHVLQRRHHLGQ